MTHAPNDAPTAAAAPPQRVRKTYRLDDIAIAPENLRFGEPADEEVPQLAATIKAAGLLQPLTVRPGRRKEKPAMALDGRRRLLALEILRQAGDIDGDYPVEVFEETDAGRQAAAVLLTNTAVPVHVADVIVSIGKMLKARLSPAMVAAALGYAELEVRRLAALSSLPPSAIQALRQGRINLRQAKLLARLPDAAARDELAQSALQGFGFPEWRVSEMLDEGGLTDRDRRFRLVGAAAYAAAGGRTVSDLFGERADVLLDAPVLHRLWTRRAEILAGVLRAEGLEVMANADPGQETPEALEPFGRSWGLGLSQEELTAWRGAEAGARAAAEALEGLDLAAGAADGPLGAWLRARLAADRLSEPRRDVTAAMLAPSCATGVEVVFLGPSAAAAELVDEAYEAVVAPPGEASPPEPTPLAAAAPVQIEGIGHALHALRTDVATRALVRALADAPDAALAVLTARLFCVLVLGAGRAKGGGALCVGADAYSRPGAAAVRALDGNVRARLAERCAGWSTSGLTPIAWVASLPLEDQRAMLAELVALSLDVREERTTSLRPAARGEAAEIEALCAADVSRHWTPDEAFLRAHPKAQLLEMLAAMGAQAEAAGGLKKDELVARVAEEAAARGWAPVWLSWTAPPQPAGETVGTPGSGEA